MARPGPALADVRDLPFAGLAACALSEQRAAAVDERARLALRLGRPTTELDALRQQLTATPLRESTAALLARGLHAAGRRADALAVLDRTRSRLAEELGVDPGAELTTAHLAVLRDEHLDAPDTETYRGAGPREGPDMSPCRGRLVAGLTSFVGRGGDVRRVRELLARIRLVTLTGPGGAGKTRLAQEVLIGSVACTAELAAITGADQLPLTLLAAVGGPEMRLRGHHPEEAPTATTERLLSTIAGRDLVLMLDNCEHLIDGVAALVAQLLAASSQLRVLATSREPLGVPGETLHALEPLADDDAVRLFLDRGAAVRPGFAPTGRPAATHRARRGPATHAEPGGDRRPARRPVPAAHLRGPHRAAAAPDAARRHRLELGPAGRAGTRGGPPARRVRGWSDAGGGRAGVRRPWRPGHPRGTRPARGAGRQVVGGSHPGRRRGGDPVPDAGDDPALRR